MCFWDVSDFCIFSTMSQNGGEDMDQLDVVSQPPSPPQNGAGHGNVDNGVGGGGGCGASVANNVVPVTVATTTMTASLGTFPSLQSPGSQQHLLLQRAQARQLQHLQQAFIQLQGVPGVFLAGAALPTGDTPQLPLFQLGFGLGLPAGGLGSFNMGALGQALPLAQPAHLPGQALFAALPPGNFGVPTLGQPAAVGGGDLGAGAVGGQPNLLGPCSPSFQLTTVSFSR